MKLTELTAFEIAEACRKKEVSPDQVLAELSAAIQASEGRLNAYVQFDPSKAHRAEGAQAGPLYGVPVAMKDNLCVQGQETTCASRILRGFVAPYHSTAARRLLDAGAVLFGRTNMDEFAFGSSCESSCYGPARNPRSEDRVPGGSSGGSAAAVAARTAVAALGTDTGGSIRQPAAFCGVVGLKPTYGRVSRYGLVAFASSLDQIGPITRDVRDAALLLRTLAGYDPQDSTCADVPVPDYLAAMRQDPRGLRIGIPAEYWEKASSADLTALKERAIKAFEGLGARFEPVSMPHTQYAVNVYYIVAPSEASSNLARFDGVRFGAREKAPSLLEMYERTRGQGFGAEAKRRIILGTYSLSSGYYDAYYLRAMKVRTLIKRDFDEAFKKVDVLMTPTAPSAAFKVGQKTQDPLQMYLSDIFTISANLAGVPAISIPGGESSDQGLPLGLQLLAKPFDEPTLLRAAYAFEQATGYHKKLGNAR